MYISHRREWFVWKSVRALKHFALANILHWIRYIAIFVRFTTFSEWGCLPVVVSGDIEIYYGGILLDFSYFLMYDFDDLQAREACTTVFSYFLPYYFDDFRGWEACTPVFLTFNVWFWQPLRSRGLHKIFSHFCDIWFWRLPCAKGLHASFYDVAISEVPVRNPAGSE